jgi:hypothetical protein
VRLHQKIGRVKAAEKEALFLDEIGELPWKRSRSTYTRRVDVRHLARHHNDFAAQGKLKRAANERRLGNVQKWETKNIVARKSARELLGWFVAIAQRGM